MKPTKKQIGAVQETIKQWKWYKENPTEDKSDYPLFIDTPLKEGISIGSNCFLCEHFANDYSCNNCPLNTKKLKCLSGHENDPFSIWCYNYPYPELRKKQCDRIINACKRWLKKYDV